MNQQNARHNLLNNQNLWKVDDTFIDHPHEKFHKEHSPLIEMTVEQWGCYQFDNVRRLPAEMLSFVEKLTTGLGIIPSKYSSIEDVCSSILRSVDYAEPYFFLVDTLVRITHDEFTHTYRHKKTGDVLNPGKIEIYELDPTWDFRPFHEVRKILNSREVLEFLNGSYIPPQFSSREEALESLFARISSIVWGDIRWFEETVEQALENHIEGVIYSEKQQDCYDASHAAHDDRTFWMAAALGVITWLKGPAALPFITEYHLIYDRLLCLNDNGTVSPLDRGGGRVVVDGVDVYTLEHLECIPNRAPDTCSCCGALVHCTKDINITALLHPVCSCGGMLDPTDTDTYSDHIGRNCQTYRQVHPPRTGFACQRCIFMTVNQMDNQAKCGRTLCPAVTCPHHMGAGARIHALTQQRTKQLTAPQNR
jgi:hypothetical protein